MVALAVSFALQPLISNVIQIDIFSLDESLPMHPFSVTNQKKLFPRNGSDHEFQIKDNILFDCIGLGKGNSYNPNRVTGFNSGKQFGYALLTYFASRALNFRRLPFCEDRIYSQYRSYNENEKNILRSLDDGRVNAICAELLALYEHTQNHLARASVKVVHIRRELKADERGYAETIARLVESAKLLKLPEIQVEMDTLNSFGDEGAYCGEVKLELEIPIEDVLYCSCLVANRPGQQDTMESGEWVVINRAPTGVVSLPTSSIHIRPGLWSEEKPFTLNDAKLFMERYAPIVLRPPYHAPPVYGTHGLRSTLKRKFIQKALAFACKDA
ncbi:MAG: hypothetical protein U1D41_05965 [Nitrosomonas sp.]|uniref:hypothetical protein n=1 Tax=Nitrosomonas sp. TaxID=42353 RepID=UPI002ABCFFF2|nr:hypothetical protein [Nitrosomonas sp.]MDZ4105698.1 hypothetical protein [Nitrosomonas sp.]